MQRERSGSCLGDEYSSKQNLTWKSELGWNFSWKMNFLRIKIWRYQNDREASGIIFLVGPSLQEMPEVTRRAYMLRMSMLVRVISWPGWASLNFCSSGHFVWNDHHIEKFEKFEHSIDFPIVFPYTCGYAGADCLTPRGWGPFFELKKYRALSDIWCQNFIKIWIFMKLRFDRTKMTGRHQELFFLASKLLDSS